MKNLVTGILTLLLAGCANTARTVTPAQAAQFNVRSAPPTPLEKIAQTEIHFMEAPVAVWNAIFSGGWLFEVDESVNGTLTEKLGVLQNRTPAAIQPVSTTVVKQ